MSELTKAEKPRLASVFANAHSENILLREMLAKLVIFARTSGGTAGADPELCAVCSEAEDLLRSTKLETVNG